MSGNTHPAVTIDDALTVKRPKSRTALPISLIDWQRLKDLASKIDRRPDTINQLAYLFAGATLSSIGSLITTAAAFNSATPQTKPAGWVYPTLYAEIIISLIATFLAYLSKKYINSNAKNFKDSLQEEFKRLEDEFSEATD